MICLEGLPDGTRRWVVGVITPVGCKDNEAMGRSIARSAGRTSKGKDFMSLAEVQPCHGE
jgi:hypothetical protein